MPSKAIKFNIKADVYFIEETVNQEKINIPEYKM
jgi:hypothetical protein